MTAKPAISYDPYPASLATANTPAKHEIAARSIDDVCRAYGVGRTFVYEQIRIGALLAKKAGRRTLVSSDELERWFASLPTAKKSNLGERHE
jgi:excisionase family DNA binding protein